MDTKTKDHINDQANGAIRGNTLLDPSLNAKYKRKWEATWRKVQEEIRKTHHAKTPHRQYQKATRTPRKTLQNKQPKAPNDTTNKKEIHSKHSKESQRRAKTTGPL